MITSETTLFDPTIIPESHRRGRGRPKGLTKEVLQARKEAEAEVAPRRPDGEILEDLLARFDMLDTLTHAAALNQISALIVAGRPGIGKTYTIDQRLTAMGGKFVSVSGGISAVELFALGYRHRKEGQVIVLDDCDGVFRDEECLSVLKAMTDSGRVRRVSWLKNSPSLDNDGIDRSYIYNGSIIFATNLDIQTTVDEAKSKNASHMAALISRALYLDLHLHDNHSLSLWINHVATEGRMFEIEGIAPEMGTEILEYLHANKNELREYSLRTVRKVCGLTKVGGDWRKMATMSLCR